MLIKIHLSARAQEIITNTAHSHYYQKWRELEAVVDCHTFLGRFWVGSGILPVEFTGIFDKSVYTV